MGLQAISLSALSDEVYRYQETTGKKVVQSEWKLKKSEYLVITSTQPGLVYTNICRANGETIRWKVQGNEISIQAYRFEEQLIIQGTKKGQKINVGRRIDSKPWFQPLSYSLRPFVKSDDREVTFWMINPDDLSVHKLKAEKVDPEKIEINGQKIETMPIEIRLSGMLSLFWSATYWFKIPEPLFVRYESVHGPPGTDKTVIKIQD